MNNTVSFECPTCNHIVSYGMEGTYSWPTCPNQCGITDDEIKDIESKVWEDVIEFFRTYEDGGWALFNIEYEAKRLGHID